jgi:hypothetical protein
MWGFGCGRREDAKLTVLFVLFLGNKYYISLCIFCSPSHSFLIFIQRSPGMLGTGRDGSPSAWFP